MFDTHVEYRDRSFFAWNLIYSCRDPSLFYTSTLNYLFRRILISSAFLEWIRQPRTFVIREMEAKITSKSVANSVCYWNHSVRYIKQNKLIIFNTLFTSYPWKVSLLTLLHAWCFSKGDICWISRHFRPMRAPEFFTLEDLEQVSCLRIDKTFVLDTEKNISDDFQKGNSFCFVKWSKLQFPKECMTEQINIL